MAEQSPRKEWSSETSGWFLAFIQGPEEEVVKRLPTRQEKIQAAERHFQKFFDQLDQLLPPGVQVISRIECFGSARIVGNEKACLELKAKVEALGLANMEKNEPCFSIPQ